MSKEAEKFIEKYTTKDQDDWLVQKKDIIAKFMESYHKKQLLITRSMGSCTCEKTKNCGDRSMYCEKNDISYR